MSRKLLILIHMYVAAFIAPMLMLVAITGGLYLMGNKGQVTKAEVSLPADATLDFKSETLDADIRALFSSMNINHDFNYIKNRGRVLQTRPTSRTHYEFTQKDDAITLTRNTSNLQYAMMELHKGHGPSIFKHYQKLVAAGLLLIVISGLWVGLAAPAYRRNTLLTAAGGLVIFLLAALVL